MRPLPTPISESSADERSAKRALRMMRSITWLDSCRLRLLRHCNHVPVNKTNEQHCRSQFAKAEGALRLLRWMEMPAAPSSQHAITHQRPSYGGLDRFGPQGWLLHLN